jgi:transcriptional regulator GlxA family with amidase domain
VHRRGARRGGRNAPAARRGHLRALLRPLPGGTRRQGDRAGDDPHQAARVRSIGSGRDDFLTEANRPASRRRACVEPAKTEPGRTLSLRRPARGNGGTGRPARERLAIPEVGDPAVLPWIKSQAAKGAIVIGVCVGAKVVAAAGLLDGRRATTHWYYREELCARHPTIHYVADRRLVIDRGVVTTTGISASMPMSLTLIEAIAGREKAEAVARDLGVTHWDARHDSKAFQFTRPFALAAMGNTIAFWNREQLGLELAPGVDEVALALVADAWSRTYRSHATTFAATAGALRTRNGLRILPDRITPTWPANRRIPAVGEQPPAQALDQALQNISARYGRRTVYLVALQLEYPRFKP